MKSSCAIYKHVTVVVVYYLLFDFRFRELNLQKWWIAPIFPKSSPYCNRNLEVKLLSIYQFRGKKCVNVNYVCHWGKNRPGPTLLNFWKVKSFFLCKVYYKHHIEDYILIKWNTTHKFKKKKMQVKIKWDIRSHCFLDQCF